MAASQKLSHLLQLADQGPALRAALAEEVAELLAAWPSDYPESMRAVCEALLAKATQDVDTTARARFREQLGFDLPNRPPPREGGFQALIEAARTGENLPTALTQSLGIDGKMAAQILSDQSGAMLAMACKRANMDRATFSALALLTHPVRDRSQAFALLDAFDNGASQAAA